MLQSVCSEDVTGAPGGSWALRALSATFRVAGTVVLLPWSTLTGLLRWAGCLPPPQTDMPKSWEAREVGQDACGTCTGGPGVHVPLP